MSPLYELDRIATETLSFEADNDDQAILIAQALATDRVAPQDGSIWREHDDAEYDELRRIDAGDDDDPEVTVTEHPLAFR